MPWPTISFVGAWARVTCTLIVLHLRLTEAYDDEEVG